MLHTLTAFLSVPFSFATFLLEGITSSGFLRSLQKSTTTQQLHFHPVSDEHKHERHGDGSEIQQADGQIPFLFFPYAPRCLRLARRSRRAPTHDSPFFPEQLEHNYESTKSNGRRMALSVHKVLRSLKIYRREMVAMPNLKQRPHQSSKSTDSWHRGR
jgi:hypothetical protein